MSTVSPSFQADVNMSTAGPQLSISNSGSTPVLPSPRMQHSVSSLEAASQAVRLRLATKEQSDKSTPATYQRHIDNYVTWWDGYQAAEISGDSTKTAIPAFPITAAKATMFLDYTSTRVKVQFFLPIILFVKSLIYWNTHQRKHGSSETIPGSVVGVSVIKQTISALESHWFQHQHLYQHVPESQVGLRLDARIRRFESAAKHNEPKRIESAQVLKASGSSSGELDHSP